MGFLLEQRLEGSHPADLKNDPSRKVPTIRSIVSTVNLDCKLDLKAIALQAPNAKYQGKRHPAVIMKMREPTSAAIILASGKMICVGARSEEQSMLMAKRFARIIEGLGYPIKFKDIKFKENSGFSNGNLPRLARLAYTRGASSGVGAEKKFLSEFVEKMTLS